MNVSDDFSLTTLPYIIQSRFMEILPYFAQIELAQTNQQLLRIYETRCKKRNTSDSVNIAFEENDVYINDKKYPYSLFKNKTSMKTCIQGNYFPTKFLSISKVRNALWLDIGAFAKELIVNGIKFLSEKQQRSASEWMEEDSTSTVEVIKFEFGWKRMTNENGDLTNRICLIHSMESKNSGEWANLSSLM